MWNLGHLQELEYILLSTEPPLQPQIPGVTAGGDVPCRMAGIRTRIIYLLAAAVCLQLRGLDSCWGAL